MTLEPAESSDDSQQLERESSCCFDGASLLGALAAALPAAANTPW